MRAVPVLFAGKALLLSLPLPAFSQSHRLSLCLCGRTQPLGGTLGEHGCIDVDLLPLAAVWRLRLLGMAAALAIYFGEGRARRFAPRRCEDGCGGSVG